MIVAGLLTRLIAVGFAGFCLLSALTFHRRSRRSQRVDPVRQGFRSRGWVSFSSSLGALAAGRLTPGSEPTSGLCREPRLAVEVV